MSLQSTTGAQSELETPLRHLQSQSNGKTARDREHSQLQKLIDHGPNATQKKFIIKDQAAPLGQIREVYPSISGKVQKKNIQDKVKNLRKNQPHQNYVMLISSPLLAVSYTCI